MHERESRLAYVWSFLVEGVLFADLANADVLEHGLLDINSPLTLILVVGDGE